MQRVAIVGAPGSGKTSLARSLGLPHAELDALWWLADWQQAPLDVFQASVAAVVAGERWVVDGFYVDEVMVPIVWPRADVIVWLDLPRATSVWRALQRSSRQALRRTALWNGNRQRLSVMSPRSIWRLWRRWPMYRATIAAAAGPDVVRLRSDAEVTAWRNSLANSLGAGG